MEDFIGMQPEASSGCLKNRCRFDEDHLREALRRYAVSPLFLILYGVLVLISLVLIGMQILLAMLHALRTDLLIETALLVLLTVFLVLYRYVLLPKFGARLQIKRNLEAGRPESYETCALFLEQEILGSADASNDLLHLQYETIKRCFRTKRMIVLVTKNRLMLMLDPSRFENGTEADFRKLLSEKCPKLRLPK